MIPPRELMGKLQLKSGERLWLINAPSEMAEELAAGAEIEMVHEKDEYDGVIVFFDSDAEADLLTPRIMAEMPPDGRLWIGGSDRDWNAVTDAGWRAAETIEYGEGRLQRYERT